MQAVYYYFVQPAFCAAILMYSRVSAQPIYWFSVQSFYSAVYSALHDADFSPVYCTACFLCSHFTVQSVFCTTHLLFLCTVFIFCSLFGYSLCSLFTSILYSRFSVCSHFTVQSVFGGTQGRHRNALYTGHKCHTITPRIRPVSQLLYSCCNQISLNARLTKTQHNINPIEQIPFLGSSSMFSPSISCARRVYFVTHPSLSLYTAHHTLLLLLQHQ